jgi:hypothetical protein
MAEEKIGEVVKFFAKASVAAVKIIEGTIKIFGHTTDVTQVIDSMEVDNKKVEKAVAGDYIGIKVADRVRPGDEVFKVVAWPVFCIEGPCHGLNGVSAGPWLFFGLGQTGLDG